MHPINMAAIATIEANDFNMIGDEEKSVVNFVCVV
jgi:hypothetical protein